MWKEIPTIIGTFSLIANFYSLRPFRVLRSRYGGTCIEKIKGKSINDNLRAFRRYKICSFYRYRGRADSSVFRIVISI